MANINYDCIQIHPIRGEVVALRMRNQVCFASILERLGEFDRIVIYTPKLNAGIGTGFTYGEFREAMGYARDAGFKVRTSSKVDAKGKNLKWAPDRKTVSLTLFPKRMTRTATFLALNLYRMFVEEHCGDMGRAFLNLCRQSHALPIMSRFLLAHYAQESLHGSHHTTWAGAHYRLVLKDAAWYDEHIFKNPVEQYHGLVQYAWRPRSHQIFQIDEVFCRQGHYGNFREIPCKRELAVLSRLIRENAPIDDILTQNQVWMRSKGVC